VANVLNVVYPTQPDQSALDDLTAAADAVMAETWLVTMKSNIVYLDTHARGLTDIVDVESINNDSTGTGTYTAGSPLPNNVTFAVKMTTGLTGRSARGRMYVVGLSTDHLEGVNSVTADLADYWVTALEAMQAAIAGVGASLCVLSRQNDSVVLAEAVPRPVTGVSYTNRNTDSQRGRLPKAH